MEFTLSFSYKMALVSFSVFMAVAGTDILFKAYESFEENKKPDFVKNAAATYIGYCLAYAIQTIAISLLGGVILGTVDDSSNKLKLGPAIFNPVFSAIMLAIFLWGKYCSGKPWLSRKCMVLADKFLQ